MHLCHKVSELVANSVAQLVAKWLPIISGNPIQQRAHPKIGIQNLNLNLKQNPNLNRVQGKGRNGGSFTRKF
jgi:hypothetical protein